MDNATFALIIVLMNAPSVALLIKGRTDHRKWQTENLKKDLEWMVERLGWYRESKTNRQVLARAGFRREIKSLQCELAQARHEITELRRRLSGGDAGRGRMTISSRIHRPTCASIYNSKCLIVLELWDGLL